MYDYQEKKNIQNLKRKRSEYTKNFHTVRKRTIQLKHEPKTFRHLTRKNIHMANKHMKRWSTSYTIREMQMKAMMKHHYTLTSMTIIWNTDNTKCWQGWGAIGTLINCWWECKMVQSPWRTHVDFFKNWTYFYHMIQGSHFGVYPRELNPCGHAKTSTHIFVAAFNDNCQNLESVDMSLSK